MYSVDSKPKKIYVYIYILGGRRSKDFLGGGEIGLTHIYTHIHTNTHTDTHHYNDFFTRLFFHQISLKVGPKTIFFLSPHS